ncbi:MAG: Mobile element protein [Tardiphaga sp.]|nr:Mobile element protein [Tardiphaga sp.]
MGIKRYELSEAQWLRIEAQLPGKVGDRGRTGSDMPPACP